MAVEFIPRNEFPLVPSVKGFTANFPGSGDRLIPLFRTTAPVRLEFAELYHTLDTAGNPTYKLVSKANGDTADTDEIDLTDAVTQQTRKTIKQWNCVAGAGGGRGLEIAANRIVCVRASGAANDGGSYSFTLGITPAST
jgi:hypothetical protein